MYMVDVQRLGCNAGWYKYEGNPVIGHELGECFDMSVVKLGDMYRMYYSWRSKKSIAMVESTDGIHWSESVIVLAPRPETGWEDDVNRISVIHKNGLFHMWYSGQVKGQIVNAANDFQDDGNGTSYIGYAVSQDGIHWERKDEPVMVPEQEWEKKSLMCPHVIWDDALQLYRMWYSAGGWFEPDAIGYASSEDGVHWKRFEYNPMFTPEPKNLWERERVAGCQVLKHGDWHYMFYIGFEDIDKARISFARSKNGVTGWERHKANPIISGGRANGWDCEAAYKPFAMFDGGRWILWYNGRKGFVEQIGVAFHDEEDLGF
jgi:predicted GH43/DUF377 family glycosyl hydrolase